jgi:hypothetical protein
MSELKVNKISPRSGTDVTLGDSGDTFTIPTGASLTSPGLTLSDNLLFNTASKGIYLGVTSATASNLLDDYEEGTWSPVINGVTFSNKGFYTKIGRMCSVHFGNQTGASIALTIGNDYAITGLPFALVSSGDMWESGSTQSASFADASAGYNSYPLTGRQTDGNAIEICNRSPVDVTSSDPLNVAMVYTTA